jgi:hypothetical protein
MSEVLERTDEITVEELEREIHAYEMFYRMETGLLLQWIADEDPRVETISEAGFWRSSHELLCRLREAPEQPEVSSEDPNRVLVHFICLATWINMHEKPQALLG